MGKHLTVDGHHRVLAHEQLGLPVRAYVAKVDVKHGEWERLHGMQKRGSSKGSVSREPSWSIENREDPAAASVTPASIPDASPKDSDAAKQAVHEQLSGDFPQDAIEWVNDVPWEGPTRVPTKDIDFSGESTWRSEKEPGKVDRLRGEIDKGNEKPVILVRRPGADKLMVVDGHHHSLAYRGLEKDALAYIATVKTKVGPWDETHSSQHEGEFVGEKADATMVPARAGDAVVKGPAVIGALEDLLREHALIRRILAVYREAAKRLRESPSTLPVDALRRAGALFRSFGEDYHERAVEEAHIFPVVAVPGTAMSATVATLIGQHNLGRELTDRLLGDHSVLVEPRSLEDFAAMYEHHAEIEEKEVFPAWAKALGAEELVRAGEIFEEIERAKLGPDGFDGAVKEMDAIESAFKSPPSGGGGGETPPAAKTDAIGSASEEEQWLADNVTQAVVEALEAYVRDLPEDKADDWDESKHERDPKGMFTSGGGGGASGGETHLATSSGHGLRGALHAAIAKLRGAAGSIGQFAVDEVKEKVHEFKTAAQGVSNFIHGREVTREQSKAIKKVALSVAASILASHVTPLVPLAHVVHAELGAKVIEKVTDQVLHHVIEFFGAKGLKLDSLLAAAVALSAGGSEGSDPKAGSRALARSDDWDESKITRDPHGQFSSTGGGDVTMAAKPSSRTFTDKPPPGLSGKQTIEEHYSGGKPTAERKAAVHDPIVHAALDKVQAPPEGAPKVAYFTMGAPGSGKSAGLRDIDQSKFVKVDPDAIKEELPEYKSAVADRANTYRLAAPMVHEEASDIAKRVMSEALASGKHVLVDGTGVSAKSLTDKMEAARAAGYHVHLAFSHLGDEAEGARRIAARAEKTGRTVPEDYRHKAYEAIPRNFDEISKHADTFDVHDTSKPDSPTVWSKTPEGEHLVDPEFVRGFKEKYQGRSDAGDWNEEAHPRAANGQFGGGGVEASGAKSGGAPREASAQEFKAAFDKAFEGDEHSGFVSHYSEAELAGMKTFLSPDGKTGVAVHDHGDGRLEATALFNKGGPPGAGTAMLKHAIDKGGANYCECFGDVLRQKYEGLGFKVESKSDFDPQYAPKDWNYAKFDRPPYYTLRLGKKDSRGDGDFDESKHPRAPNGQFGEGEGATSAPASAESYFKGDKGRLSRLHSYTEFDYAKMNEFQRDPVAYATKHGEKDADKQHDKADAFMTDLRSAPKEPGVASRGVMLPKEAIAKLQPGVTTVARGTWSATKDAAQAEGFAHQTAEGAVKKGDPRQPVVLHITHRSGVSLGAATTRPEEKEVLIPHGTKLHVDRVEHKGGLTHVHLTEA